MSQQLVVQPVGVITQPNSLGQFPSGAMFDATRCYIRNPGALETAPAWISKSTAFTAGAAIYVVPFGQYALLVYFHTTSLVPQYFWVDLATGATVVGSIQFLSNEQANNQTLNTLGRLSASTIRNRIVFTTGGNTVFLWDASAAPTFPIARTAGLLPPAVCFAFASTTTTTGAIKGTTACMVTAILRRKYADGYEIVSAPAPGIFVYNGVTSPAVITSFNTFTSGYAQVGDVLETYRTRSQPTTTGGGTNPGGDYYLSATRTLTSGDLSSGYQFNDTCPDENMGQALYTNEGLSGAAGTAFPPPTCRSIATFKGCTFYLNRTDPPTLKFRVPVYWGTMGNSSTGFNAFVRANGIGVRTVRGTTTIGSPTITGVSAGDIVGIVIGQQAPNSIGSTFPPAAIVTAVGASTITFNGNALTAGAATVDIADQIVMDGSICGADNFSLFVYNGGIGRNFSQNLRFGQALDQIYTQTTPAAIDPSTSPAGDLVISRLIITAQNNPITIRATNGANFVPPLPKLELNETALSFAVTNVPNGLSWSEQNQPENVPPLNTAFCGSGEIYAAFSTRDALWIFASDGLWRLSGTGGDVAGGFDWRIDPVDSTLSLAGPQAGCVLRDTVYAYTNRGLVSIDSSGEVKEISQGRINDLLPGPPWSTPTWNVANAMFLVADETNDEIVMREPLGVNGRIWIYNTLTDAFTLDFPDTSSSTGASTFGIYSRFLQSVLVQNTNQGTLIAPLGTTYKVAIAAFQPLYADNPFVLRHWQSLNVAFSTASAGINQIICYLNAPKIFSSTGVNAGAISLTSSAVGRDPNAERASWGIPRDSPAVANSIGVSLFIGNGGETSKKVLQGIALDYVDLTPQRKSRDATGSG